MIIENMPHLPLDKTFRMSHPEEPKQVLTSTKTWTEAIASTVMCSVDATSSAELQLHAIRSREWRCFVRLMTGWLCWRSQCVLNLF